jgi:hypothetical protein
MEKGCDRGWSGSRLSPASIVMKALASGSWPVDIAGDDLLDQLAGKERVLAELAASYAIDWFRMVGVQQGQGGVELGRTLLARLVTLPGDLLLDLYVSDEPAEPWL